MPEPVSALSRHRRTLRAKVSAGISSFLDGISPLSLRGRLVLVFVVFLSVWFMTGSWALWNQSLKAEQLSIFTEKVSTETIDIINARELLRSVRKSNNYVGIRDDLARINQIIGKIDFFVEINTGISKVEIIENFERFSQLVDSGGDLGSIDRIYQTLMTQLDAVVARNQELISMSAAESRIEQARFFRIGITVLVLFFLLSIQLVSMAIRVVGRPIASVEKFIREIDLDHNSIPVSSEAELAESGVPELTGLKKSLDEFLKKISGRHTLNVQNFFVEKKRADLIASSISDGILLLKGETITYVNPVGERLLGFAPGSLSPGLKLTSLLRRHTDEEIAPDSPSARGAQAILSSISRSMPVEFSLTTSANDRISHYLIHARPVSGAALGPNSNPNIDPQKLIAASLAGETEPLILVVAQDVTLVKESQEAKGHFLATLSHEIKTPVTSLTMATRLLKRSSHQIPNPTLQNLIATCADDVDRLRALLTDLLSISGFDTLTQKLAVQNVDLGRLIKHSVHSFKAEAIERGLELACDIQLVARRPILVNVDPTKIAWAISNLMTNALRHTPKGGVVTVSAREHAGWAEVRVRDTGPGIDKRRLAQVFEKFSSYYDIRVARSGGAGIGLAITREIVVAHRGRIWASSEPGHGAEFCFTLPLIRAEKKSTDEENRGPGSQNSSDSDVAEVKGLTSGKTANSG